MSPSCRSPHFPCFLLVTVLAVCLFLSACVAGNDAPAADVLSIRVQADDQTLYLSAAPGITVEEALEQTGVRLDSLDRVDPALEMVMLANASIAVTRISEEYEIEEIAVPFQTQTIQNETLAAGQTIRVQAGVNGLVLNTWRIRYENGAEVSRCLFRQETVTASAPEILMTGVQLPVTETRIPGKIAYLSAGNAWIMQDTSGRRTPLVTSGDLDGRIFTLSADGRWLLFTRSPREITPTRINELWMIDTGDRDAAPVYLSINNVIHFAVWRPGDDLVLAYSTVEPRDAAPGWQANNDLTLARLSETGEILEHEVILETNSGGVLGWWGTNFAWAPDGGTLAYTGSDSLGLIDLATGEKTELAQILPWQSGGNTVWLPGIAWAADGKTLYFVSHGTDDSGNLSSGGFSLMTVSALFEDTPELIRADTGMYAFPAANPDRSADISIAWLQAEDPQSSQTGLYRLYAADQTDGNARSLFPPETSPGLEPQIVHWQPQDAGEPIISLVYQGNIWQINLKTSQFNQLTGDGSVTLIDWK